MSCRRKKVGPFKGRESSGDGKAWSSESPHSRANVEERRRYNVRLQCTTMAATWRILDFDLKEKKLLIIFCNMNWTPYEYVMYRNELKVNNIECLRPTSEQWDKICVEMLVIQHYSAQQIVIMPMTPFILHDGGESGEVAAVTTRVWYRYVGRRSHRDWSLVTFHTWVLRNDW
jgi:hypothetical protein